MKLIYLARYLYYISINQQTNVNIKQITKNSQR